MRRRFEVPAEWSLEMNDFYLAVPLQEVPEQQLQSALRMRTSWGQFDTILQRRHWAWEGGKG